ncbi:MAG TPA: penicillin-binding protein 2 [Verrucomicrobiae bacterium]|jgi:cell division protein FtsI/penicillin-binding protein 2|nr:penicillin-binding protein 2 [Verrucomicrobiae bacterium]
MIAAAQIRKLYFLTALLGLGLCALAGRLVDLQAFRHEELKSLGERNTVRTIARAPMRGQIMDIRGNLLATSVPAKTICADPSLLGRCSGDVARLLAPLLQTNEAYVADRLTPRWQVENGRTNLVKYIVLKRKASVDDWEKIKAAMAQACAGVNEKELKPSERMFYRNLRTKAIFAEDDQIRFYPNHELAAQVVGFVANDEDQTGLQGIEYAFNSKLAGVHGWRRTEMDKRQRELVAYRDQDVEPRDGLNVVLTLDAGLQNIAESELGEAIKKHSPKSISCIITRPRTGEILAMATRPTFDPNAAGSFPAEDLRNRMIADVAEPGSTFKVVVITAGLNEGVVTLNDVFDCENGHFAFAGRVLHDHEPYGLLTVQRIITKSSNIGAAKVGLRLGQERLYDYIHDFGFGRRTGIPLPGEEPGIVHAVTNWSKVSIAQIPMGQGIAVTPLQMVMAMSAIANKGQLMRPMLVSRIEDADGKTLVQYEPQAMRTVAGLPAIKDMVTALKTVPTADGTAVEAHLDHYTVAGKTGTAQKVEHGQYVQKFFSSFIGFFPADNPEICISVVMDDPKDGHYGGKVSAPVFHAIAERAANYLNLKPDVELPPPVTQTLTASVAK